MEERVQMTEDENIVLEDKNKSLLDRISQLEKRMQEMEQKFSSVDNRINNVEQSRELSVRDTVRDIKDIFTSELSNFSRNYKPPPVYVNVINQNNISPTLNNVNISLEEYNEYMEYRKSTRNTTNVENNY
eukprot:TRINITY_DN13665_c0_g1_i1.p1 TRINITY_DN13665_c0_g1~~TRINITY_DN13665_c0_g1_i1.p1  ORF type:complete len:130 (-),score=32.31 TRINITY_DN13665_c0_g1_i1:4-393(-)